jgi:hypothetical protein
MLCFRIFREGHFLSNRKLLVIASASNVLLIALCFAVYGMNLEGAGSATRNTARFAICFFLAGFAAPGLRKWLSWYPQPAPLIQAFVAAQMVHFCAVIALHTRFAAEPLHLGLPQIAVVLLGFSLILAIGILATGISETGMTATSRPQSRVSSAAYVVLLYVVWLILAADYPGHPVKPVRLVAIPVFLALVLRHLPRGRATHFPLTLGEAGETKSLTNPRDRNALSSARQGQGRL